MTSPTWRALGQVVLVYFAVGGCAVTAQDTQPGRATFAEMVAFARLASVPCNILAVGARLPTMHGSRDYVEAGGLMSFGANFPHQFRRSADYVDKILRGAKPADLPVQQPTKFDLIVNVITAKAIGLRIPPTLLARAGEVIE